MNEVERLLQKISDLAFDEDVGEPLDDAIGYANKALAVLRATTSDGDAVAFINTRLADLAEANAIYGKDRRLSAPDKVARNNREISWLKELRSLLALSPETAKGREWQPIYMAPRDGTPIEVCNTRHPSSPPVIVRWTDDGLGHDLPEPHWCDAATADGSALYYNQNYFDFWKPTTPLPSADSRGGK